MDIPEDVMKTARSVYMGLMTTCERWSEEDVMVIARAIIAERERCAKVATVQFDKDVEPFAHMCGGIVASSIRRGGQ